MEKLQIFKRPKNREDSSDFDDFWTELIVMTWPIIWSKLRFFQFFSFVVVVVVIVVVVVVVIVVVAKKRRQGAKRKYQDTTLEN